MGGVLHHLFAGLASALVVHLFHLRIRYSLAILIGNLLPDALRIIPVAIKQGTISLFSIDQTDPLYSILQNLSHMQVSLWFVVGFFVFGVAALLFHYHYIKKKQMESYDLLYVYLLLGVLTHLVMDLFIMESGPWY